MIFIILTLVFVFFCMGFVIGRMWRKMEEERKYFTVARMSLRQLAKR